MKGIERAAFGQPDLILLDVVIPNMDGFETCRRLKTSKRTREIPVIFLTALEDPSHRLMGFAAGGIDYITKPLHIGEVSARISVHLGLRAAQKQLAEQNAQLQQEIAIRRKIEVSLQHARDQLEDRVAQRTRELAATNAALLAQISERQRAEKWVTLFRSLIDHIKDSIEVIDPETGRFLDVNEKACQACGYSRDEYLELKVSDIDPQVAAHSWAEIRDDMRHTGFRVFESQHRRKDGSLFPVEVNVTYIRLDRDFLAVVRDITDRRALEEQLRQAQKM